MASDKTIALWTGVGSAVGEAALQVSGYQNVGLAIVLGIVSAGGLGYGGFLFVRETIKRRKLANPRLQRRLNALTHALPIIGVVLGGLTFVGSIAWILADLRRSTDRISENITRYVLPRHLTTDQIAIIAKYLTDHPPAQQVKLLSRNGTEASLYMSDFKQALEQGGWRVLSTGYADNISDGITTTLTQTIANSKKPRDPTQPSASDLFVAALRQAKVRMGGSSTGQDQNLTEDSFTINIGRRQMDDGDLIVKQLREENARKVLDGTYKGRPR